MSICDHAMTIRKPPSYIAWSAQHSNATNARTCIPTDCSPMSYPPLLITMLINLLNYQSWSNKLKKHWPSSTMIHCPKYQLNLMPWLSNLMNFSHQTPSTINLWIHTNSMTRPLLALRKSLWSPNIPLAKNRRLTLFRRV